MDDDDDDDDDDDALDQVSSVHHLTTMILIITTISKYDHTQLLSPQCEGFLKGGTPKTHGFLIKENTQRDLDQFAKRPPCEHGTFR